MSSLLSLPGHISIKRKGFTVKQQLMVLLKNHLGAPLNTLFSLIWKCPPDTQGAHSPSFLHHDNPLRVIVHKEKEIQKRKRGAD